MPSRSHVLVVEDDTAIRRGVVDALESEGFETLEAADLTTAMRLALTAEYNLMLLDLVLPTEPPKRRASRDALPTPEPAPDNAPPRDGLELLQRLRTSRPTTPVIILTARGEENDRVRGLKLGADDYVVKPFSLHELLARVQAVLRRSPQRSSPTKCFKVPGHNGTPAGTIDIEQRRIEFTDGRSAALSEREAELLGYLATHGGRVISRDELLLNVWRLEPAGVETRTIDMHVTRLREKLRDDAAEPAVLRTVRGKGYTLAVETGQ